MPARDGREARKDGTAPKGDRRRAHAAEKNLQSIFKPYGLSLRGKSAVFPLAFRVGRRGAAAPRCTVFKDKMLQARRIKRNICL